ncbi:MAG: hypothetical protein LBG19_07015 [Prevotellaceae bacterium]|jgi:hypothetical protein|nr:hypothetical protein [Prevotellaceae bacterium]
MKGSKYMLLALLMAVPFCGSAQKKLIFSPGVSYQKEFFGELSIMYAETATNNTGLGIYGPKLGIEMNFSSDSFIYASKLGFEVDVLFFSVRANAVSYIKDGNVDLRLLPEVGFGFFGLANLTYGYGIPVLNYRVEDVSRYRVTLTFNLSRDLWRDIFK